MVKMWGTGGSKESEEMTDKEEKRFRCSQRLMEKYIKKLDDEELTYLINCAVREMDERLEDFKRYKTKEKVWTSNKPT